MQGIGSFVAPLLASRVFFAHTVDSAQGLKNVQWVYLGVACFVALLLILFLLAPFPEITDADMGMQETEIEGQDAGPFRKQYTLFLGTWSQFCYVGAQVALAGYFINFAQEAGKTSAQACEFYSIGNNIPLFLFLFLFLFFLPFLSRFLDSIFTPCIPSWMKE